MEGNITWQSTHIGRQVTPTAGASPQVVNRQATPAIRATNSSQVGRQVTQATGASQAALNSQAGSQLNTGATPRQ